jgi:hypothetical protein
VLLVRNELAHERDQLLREQRVLRDVVDAERDAVVEDDVGESRLLDLLGEVTLRQGARNSAGPRRLAGQHLWRQIVLHREIGDAQPAARSQHPVHFRQRSRLSG